jgi:hypothetical protein
MAKRKVDSAQEIEVYPRPSLELAALQNYLNISKDNEDLAVDMTRKMIKGLNKPDGEIQTAKAIKEAQKRGFVIGAKVKLPYSDTPEVGVVVGYNQTPNGFYSGDRYPVLVKFERGTFEYGISEKELVLVP